MDISLDIKKIREKAVLIIEKEYEDKLTKYFDEEGYLDLIENIDDYIAEGLVSHYYKQYVD